ncbi:MAG: alpha/beta fold hydrolase [Tannerellaceae bacterium]|nr:alpha/beta fold hydrolase [Tannerellaceae bacterium]
MKKLVAILCLILLFVSCQSKPHPVTSRECVLDSISYVHDSICYHIEQLPRLCEELNMQGQMVDIGDCRLYCEVAGKGTPLVVINGGPGGSHHCFHPWFTEAEKFCRVIYYDQRGCAQSDYEPGEEGYSFRQAMEDLDKLREQLGIDQWVVCGYSYGGALAQYYTANHPERVKGMVLMGPALMPRTIFTGGSRQQMFISAEERERIQELYTLYRDGKIDITQLLYNKEINGDWKRQHFYKPTYEESVRSALYEWVHDDTFREGLSAYSQYDLSKVFVDMPIPTLICEGKWDLTWTPKKTEVIQRIHPEGELVVFERAGHSVFSEDPGQFFPLLKRFVKSLDTPSGEEIRTWKEYAAGILQPQEKLFAREKKYLQLIEKEGVRKAIEYYEAFRRDSAEVALFTDGDINNVAYGFLQQGNPEICIMLSHLILREYPESIDAYENLGDAYVKLEDTEQARIYYEKVLALNPNRSWTKNALASLNKPDKE